MLKRIGVSGVNKPKATPSHPTKSHVVVAKSGDKVKVIRFGQKVLKQNRPVKVRVTLTKQKGVASKHDTLKI